MARPAGLNMIHYDLTPPTTPMQMSRVRTLPWSGREIPSLDNSRRFPTLPYANLRYQELGQVRNMDKKRIQLPFLSAHFAELSWSKDTTI